MKYRASSMSILLPSGDLVQPGCEVPDGALSEKQIATLLKEGSLIPEEKAAPTAPAVPAEENKGRPPSAWALDPSSLTKRKLKELQVMIRERDEKQALPETVEECVALLSQDFEAQ